MVVLTRFIALAMILAMLPCGTARAADPLMTVLKATLVGSITGLVLGGTLTLVVDDESRSETVRWGVVIGTFAGFGVGVWQAATGRDDLFAGWAGSPAAQAQRGLQPAALATGDRADAPRPEGLGHARAGCQVRLSLLRLSW